MKKTTATNVYCVTCMLATAASTAFAEDIDIYSQNTSITPGAPNVLIVMDNTANWSQASPAAPSSPPRRRRWRR